MQKHYSLTDQFIMNVDLALKTLFTSNDRITERKSPALKITQAPLSSVDNKHVAGLMRINHTGEVCAQALYQGQALTAKLEKIKISMAKAAEEETDHLGWCELRLKELNTQTSFLNPAWYALSLSIGALAGLAGDKWSLGFVVETEKQVTKHLESHIEQLPKTDIKSLKILQQMVIDETSHATMAHEAGGIELPLLIKTLMKIMSKIMTKTSYHL